ncbi:hypothetical protein NDU88_003134 [Pleurodeles waltl]|uniref:Uncharacterized protein n=1 Tax=Pleurodeles waltl TaxID=8319 RepID=A0AAV7RFQ2_PLEWA|nr:hypothetical protein NDU88_003134 [Pleurodeles waltl]
MCRRAGSRGKEGERALMEHQRRRYKKFPSGESNPPGEKCLAHESGRSSLRKASSNNIVGDRRHYARGANAEGNLSLSATREWLECVRAMCVTPTSQDAGPQHSSGPLPVAKARHQSVRPSCYSEGASSQQQQGVLPRGRSSADPQEQPPDAPASSWPHRNPVSSGAPPGLQGLTRSSPPLVFFWQHDPAGPGHRPSSLQAVCATTADRAQALPVFSLRKPNHRDSARAPVGAPASSDGLPLGETARRSSQATGPSLRGPGAAATPVGPTGKRHKHADIQRRPTSIWYQVGDPDHQHATLARHCTAFKAG